jgi:hypothetical protein
MYDNTYWNNDGKYQEQYDILKQKIPSRSKAKESHIDLVRCMGNIYYDTYNNGGCNFDVRIDEFQHILYYTDELLETCEISQIELSAFALKYKNSLNGIYQNLFDGFAALLEKVANAVIKYAFEED